MKTNILILAAAVVMALATFSIANDQNIEPANSEMTAGWFDDLWRKVTPAVGESSNSEMMAGWFDNLWRHVVNSGLWCA